VHDAVVIACDCLFRLCAAAAANTSCSSPDSVIHGFSPRSEREQRERKMQASIRHLERHREDILHVNKLVGKPTESNVAAVNYHTKLRRVNFKWQRGIKIGQ